MRNLSLDVHAGETVCVVGESGSGKSVTSLAVMGLLPQGIPEDRRGLDPRRGRGRGHRHARRLRERATRMAMVFQEPMTALNPVHTVGKQVDEVLRLHRKMSAAERRAKVLEMFRSVHLPDVERIYDAYPHQLSGGQRQRIVIAMALILEPRLLIADEPTTALDVTTQKQILALIKELQVKHKTAVLFITHDFGVVAEISDRIIVMNRGDLVESGTRHEILAEPKQSYTRRLVSSVPSLVPSRREAPPASRCCTSGPGPHLWRRRLAVLAQAGARRGRGRRQPDAAQGRDPGHRGRVRLGQIHGRALHRAPDRTHRRPHDDGRRRPAPRCACVRRIQIVFQDPYRSLNPRRTVGESIIEGLLNFGVPREQALQRAGETLSVVGLSPDAMRRYPHQFSGGQRQRICIARALVMDPEILVADEAVSALDVSVQAQVLELLEQVRQRTGVGVLFITHDLRVAAQICDTIIVMQRGRSSRPAAPRPC